MTLSKLSHPTDQLKNARSLPNVLRNSLKDSLLSLEKNLWLKACRDWAATGDEEWLRTVSMPPDGEPEWVMAVFENAPIRTPAPLTSQVQTARSIAGCALSSLLLRGLTESLEAATKLAESLYRAVAQWQPTSSEVMPQADGQTIEAMRRALLSSAGHGRRHWAALEVVRQARPAWEVKPVGDLVDYFAGEEVGTRGRAVELNVMLDCGIGGGLVVKLLLAKRDGGSGKLYRDPLTMSFLQYSEDFQDALTKAWDYARASNPDAESCDVVWRLTSAATTESSDPSDSFNRMPEYVKGTSAGAGFALGLKYLFDERLSPDALREWAVTGSVTRDGVIGRVIVSRNKLTAVATEKLKTLMPLTNYAALKPEWAGKIKVLEGAATVEDAHDVILREELRERREALIRVWKKRFSGLLATAAGVLSLLLVIAVNQWSLASTRGEQLQAQKAVIERINSQLEDANKELEGKNKGLGRANEGLAEKNEELDTANRQVALERDKKEQQRALADVQRRTAEQQRQIAEVARKNEQQQRQNAEEQRRLAEAAREEEGRQRKRAEELEKLASAQRQVAVARQAELQADRAMVENDPADAQLLYAKALTLDERADTRGRYLQARAKPFMKLAWSAGVSYSSGRIAISADGRVAAVGKEDSSLSLLDAATGQGTKTLINERSASISSVAFSPNGRQLAAAGGNGIITLWDYDAGKQIRESLYPGCPDPNKPTSKPDAQKNKDEDEDADENNCSGLNMLVAYSQDGSKLAAGFTGDPRIVIWDAFTGKVISTLNHPSPYLSDLAFDHNGNLVVTGLTGDIWILPPDDGALTNLSHGVKILSSTVNPDGTLLLTVGDNLIRIWDLNAKRELTEAPLRQNSVVGAGFTANGRLIVSAGSDGIIKLWETSSGKEVLTFSGNIKEVDDIALDKNGQLLVRSALGTIKSWGLTPGKAAVSLGQAPGTTADVAFSRDGGRLASLVLAQNAKSLSINIWDAGTRQLSRRLNLNSLLATAPRMAFTSNEGDFYLPPLTLQFSKDDKYIALGGVGPSVPVFDVQTGEQLAPFLPRKKDEFHVYSDIAFSPDGRRFAAAADDAVIHIWDVVTKSEERLLSGHEGPITCIRFSPDGAALSSSSMDGTIRVWDIATGKTTRTLGRDTDEGGFAVLSIDYSPDGKQIASTSTNQKVSIWDLSSGREVINHESFDMTVMALAFSPNGRWLAWGSLGESAIHLLDVATGEEVPSLHVTTGTLTRVSFSPDGGWLAMAGGDAEIYLWNMPEIENSYKSSPAALLAGAESDTGLSITVNANSFTGDAMTILDKADLYTALGLTTESSFTIVPSSKEQGQGTENCTPVPIVATLNPFPTSFINPAPPCHNFPTLDARIVEGDKYSGNEVVRSLGRNAKVGDTVRVRVYIDNGAANSMPPAQTVAKNVKVDSSVDTESGTEHTIKVSLTGDNTNTVSRIFTLRTDTNSILEVIPNSGQVRNWQNQVVRDNVQIGGNTFPVGDLEPGFATDLFLYFDVKVAAADKSPSAEARPLPRRPTDGENSTVTSSRNKGVGVNCPNPPTVATLNPYRISFAPNGEPCTNYPPIDIGVAGRYSTSEDEWNGEHVVKAGDEFFVLVYIDNGAANSLPLAQTVAKNIQVTTTVDTTVGARHSIGVSFGGDNTNTVSKTLRVRTGPDEFLEVVPNSGMLFDAYNHALQNNLPIANGVVGLSDMAPGFATDVFLRFVVHVKSARGKDHHRALNDESSTVTSFSNKGLTNDCRNPPSVATLNPFPLSFGDNKASCLNYPPVDLRLASGGKYSQNEEEWNQGRTAKAGDELYVLMYIDNGAANNLPLAQTLARNVRVTTSVDREVGPEHRVGVSFSGDNTNVVAKTLPIRTGAGEYLEVVPNSGEVFNLEHSPLKSNIELGNSTYLVGDIKPGFETDLFLRFKIRVKSAEKDAPRPIYKEDARISRSRNKGPKNCPDPPEVATLNPFPLTFSTPPGDCMNYAPLDLSIGGRYSQSEEELNAERRVKAGEEFYAAIYIDNGAANTLPIRQTMAKNVQVKTFVDTTVGSRHTVSVSFKGDNTNTVSKTLTVITAPDEFLEVVPNSGEVFDWQTVLLKSNLQLGNNTYSVGDIGPGFETDLFLRFMIRVKSMKSQTTLQLLDPDSARVTQALNKGQTAYCPDAPGTATLNPFPVTFSSPAENCKNYEPIDVRLATEDGKYSQNEEDWKDGIRAKVGDELYVAMYVDNGAANNLPLRATLARNVKVTTGVDTLPGTVHLVSVSFAGDNTNKVSASFPIFTEPNSYLEIVPNSGQIRNFTATEILKDKIQIGNNTIDIGDLAPGFNTDLFIRFTVKVLVNKNSR